MPTPNEKFTRALEHHANEFGVELSLNSLTALSEYYALILKWNPRLRLVAPCSPEEFATRHVLESLLLLNHLPPNPRVADVGSGAGLPIIPCLILRDDLRAILIESSTKKSVFLREALRLISSPERAEIVTARFEDILAPEVDFVTCRALDRFGDLLMELINWSPGAAVLLLFVGVSLRDQITSALAKSQVDRIPRSENRFLVIAER